MNGIFFVLAHIMIVESGGQKLGMHPDGASYGLFGLTEVACVDVGEKFPPETPRDELRVAKKYLETVNERFKCDNLWLASGFYHGGDAERRKDYVDKVRAVDGAFARKAFDEVYRSTSTNALSVVKDVECELACLDPLEGADDRLISKLENRILQLSDLVKELKNKKH